eukprot:8827550-Alexandrium_andersonii.AAC.1
MNCNVCAGGSFKRLTTNDMPLLGPSIFSACLRSIANMHAQGVLALTLAALRRTLQFHDKRRG